MKSISLFVILLILTLFLTFASNQTLNIDDLSLNSLAEQFTSQQLDELLSNHKKWSWIGYTLIPIFLLIKISIIAFLLDLGLFFFDKKIKFKKLFNIVVRAEFIFLLVIIFKTLWFFIFQQDYSLEEYQYFYPLSVLNIVGYEGLQNWFIYPFQVLNLFEVAYWLALTYLISKTLKIPVKKGLSIVASSYGIALLIWVVGVMFLTLNLS